MTEPDPCAKVNCLCEKVDGWPWRNAAGGWWHLHAEEPRLIEPAEGMGT